MNLQFTRTLTATMCSVLLSTPLVADERGKLIFQDEFNRREPDEDREDIGNGWSSNSGTRAGGNKQVDLRNGTLYIFPHKTADHGVSVRHDVEFQNGTVELRFMLENDKDTLGLDFADMTLKTVHAGHLFKVTVGTKKLEITDMKTGTMDLKIRQARQIKSITPELKELLATKKKTVPVKLKTGQWYSLAITISGDTISVMLDGKSGGSVASAGFAHPTKRLLRLAVPREAVIDDLKIFSAK